MTLVVEDVPGAGAPMRQPLQYAMDLCQVRLLIKSDPGSRLIPWVPILCA